MAKHVHEPRRVMPPVFCCQKERRQEPVSWPRAPHGIHDSPSDRFVRVAAGPECNLTTIQ